MIPGEGQRGESCTVGSSWTPESAVPAGLLPPQARWKGPVRGHPCYGNVLRGPQVRTAAFPRRPALGPR